MWIKVSVAQSDCLQPKDSSPPGSFVHGILQARIQEAGSHSLLQGNFLIRGLNQGRVFCIAGRFSCEPGGKAQLFVNRILMQYLGSQLTNICCNKRVKYQGIPPVFKHKYQHLDICDIHNNVFQTKSRGISVHHPQLLILPPPESTHPLYHHLNLENSKKDIFTNFLVPFPWGRR